MNWYGVYFYCALVGVNTAVGVAFDGPLSFGLAAAFSLIAVCRAIQLTGGPK
jgi:hypothetical protein